VLQKTAFRSTSRQSRDFDWPAMKIRLETPLHASLSNHPSQVIEASASPVNATVGALAAVSRPPPSGRLVAKIYDLSITTTRKAIWTPISWRITAFATSQGRTIAWSPFKASASPSTMDATSSLFRVKTGAPGCFSCSIPPARLTTRLTQSTS
jgi:hypothetical protein